MEKKKLQDEMLDGIAGGVISNGLVTIKYNDGKVKMLDEMRGKSVSFGEDEFKSSLVSQGVPSQGVESLLELIRSGKSYSPVEVKQMTGVEIRLRGR